MQDSATFNTAHTTLNFLQGHRVNVLHWPSKWPDLSLIEQIWNAIVGIIRGWGPARLRELQQFVKEG